MIQRNMCCLHIRHGRNCFKYFLTNYCITKLYCNRNNVYSKDFFNCAFSLPLFCCLTIVDSARARVLPKENEIRFNFFFFSALNTISIRKYHQVSVNT